MPRTVALACRYSETTSANTARTGLALNIRPFLAPFLGFVVFLSTPLPRPMSDPKANFDPESVVDADQGHGMDLSFIHNGLLVLTFIDDSYVSQQDQAPPGESNFSDGSEALFSMYLNRAKEEDRMMADTWKGYADGMLVFVSLRTTSHFSPIK